MGYRREPQPVLLSFSDETMEGLAVHCRTTSVGEFLRAVGLTGGGLAFTPANEGRLRSLCDVVMGTVTSWNLEHHETGEPVPPTGEGLLAQDRAFLSRFVDAWMDGQVAVPGPLPKPSAAGETPGPLASLPMEPMPESQAS